MPDQHVPGRPDPDRPELAAIAGLARELEALARTVDALAGLPARVEDLAGILAALAAQIAAAPTRTRPDGVPSWLDGPGEFAEAVTTLADLAAWIGEIYLRYTDATGLPECWLWHPDLVEELLWLRGAWLEAYRGERASVALAGDWHDRARPGVVRRIRAVAGTCSLETHQRGGERHRGADPAPLAEAIHLIGDWWTTDRRACPPAPDSGHIAAAAVLRAMRGRR